MKKQILLLCLAIAGFITYGQSPVPNGNFENWTSATFDYPQNYQNTSNSEEFFRFGLPFNITKTADAYHGSYAVQLETNASATDTAVGYFININPQNEPSAWTGGMPYGQKPTGLRGWYKYNIASADSGTIIVAFSKGGNNIGTYFLKIGGIHTEYTLFNFTFDPALSETPDSVALGALSSKFLPGQDKPNGPAGSILKLDSLSFSGVGSQPSLMNGDFENWQSETINTPNDWYIQGDNGAGYMKTSDASAGDFALELITYAGNQDNHPAAQAGKISTGYYPDNCNGNCHQMGGYPFTNQIDTLTFYYKYIPAHPLDSAWISVSLKKDGDQFWGTSAYLLACDHYIYMELPVNATQAPDSVIIDIQSSLWQNISLSYVGADLMIDEIQFKSQILPTGIFDHKTGNSISIFPNPTSGKIRIEGLNSDIQQLEIYNIYGKMIYSSAPGIEIMNEIDITGHPKGVYFVKIVNGNRIQTQKFVIR